MLTKFLVKTLAIVSMTVMAVKYILNVKTTPKSEEFIKKGSDNFASLSDDAKQSIISRALIDSKSRNK